MLKLRTQIIYTALFGLFFTGIGFGTGAYVYHTGQPTSKDLTVMKSDEVSAFSQTDALQNNNNKQLTVRNKEKGLDKFRVSEKISETSTSGKKEQTGLAGNEVIPKSETNGFKGFNSEVKELAMEMKKFVALSKNIKTLLMQQE